MASTHLYTQNISIKISIINNEINIYFYIYICIYIYIHTLHQMGSSSQDGSDGKWSLLEITNIFVFWYTKHPHVLASFFSKFPHHSTFLAVAASGLNDRALEVWTSRLAFQHGGFLSHGGTPSYHPFLDGIFPNKNHPAMGIPPLTMETLHMLQPLSGMSQVVINIHFMTSKLATCLSEVCYFEGLVWGCYAPKNGRVDKT